MADPDAASKARILSHMNADHSDSITLYLRHYLRLPSSEAQDAQITDITFDTMTFLTRSKRTVTIPLTPPMTSWAQARERTVEMDRESRKGLNIPSFKLTKYIPPSSPFQIFVFVACLFTAGIFLTREKIVPGTWFYDVVLPWFPGGPGWFLWIARRIAGPVVGIHVLETVGLDLLRLRKFGVERGTGVWWLWIGSCLCEGFGCYARIGRWAKEQEREEGKKDH